MAMPIEWIPESEKPTDAQEWEQVVRERVKSIEGTGPVRMRRVDSGWWLECARQIGPSPVDLRFHLTEALRKAGKPVIGVTMLQGEPPLSAEREAAIRSALSRSLEAPATTYDVQVVSDLLGEVDRLRAKLQLAAHARDLTGEGASKLRDACEDITPRPARSFERKSPRQPVVPGPNE